MFYKQKSGYCYDFKLKMQLYITLIFAVDLFCTVAYAFRIGTPYSDEEFQHKQSEDINNFSKQYSLYNNFKHKDGSMQKYNTNIGKLNMNT